MSYESALETIIDLCTTQDIVGEAYELAAIFDDGEPFDRPNEPELNRQLWDAIVEGADSAGYCGLDVVDNAIAETEFGRES